jgi:hypothetical protein
MNEKTKTIDVKIQCICQKCSRILDINLFKKRGDKMSATCKECLDKHMQYLKKNKCEHGKLNKSACKDCNGTSVCKHGISKTYCKHCGGGSLCEHNKRKDRCSECEHIYGRKQYCEHKVLKTHCKKCDGGSICEHKKRRTRCNLCKGGSMCSHNKQKSTCKYCDFSGFLCKKVRDHVYRALKKSKSKKSIEYLECDIDTYKKYIEKQFVEGMTWDNYGTEWHIDHIVPLKYNNPKIEEVIKRLHYENTQPLWVKDNLIKGNQYISWLQQEA